MRSVTLRRGLLSRSILAISDRAYRPTSGDLYSVMRSASYRVGWPRLFDVRFRRGSRQCRTFLTVVILHAKRSFN